MVDHRIGLQIFDRTVEEAEADRDAGNAGIAGAGNVVDRVAQEDGAAATGPLDHRMDRRRIGLGNTNRVTGHDRGETVEQAQLVQQGNREAFRLVGADGELHAARRQSIQHRHHAGIGQGMERQILFIIIEQDRQRLVEDRLVIAARRVERALQHHLGPLAHEGPDGIDREGGSADRADGIIDRRGQIAAGVEQGAVEVEADNVEG